MNSYFFAFSLVMISLLESFYGINVVADSVPPLVLLARLTEAPVLARALFGGIELLKPLFCGPVV